MKPESLSERPGKFIRVCCLCQKRGKTGAGEAGKGD